MKQGENYETVKKIFEAYLENKNLERRLSVTRF